MLWGPVVGKCATIVVVPVNPAPAPSPHHQVHGALCRRRNLIGVQVADKIGELLFDAHGRGQTSFRGTSE
jgi:hypothetical protein